MTIMQTHINHHFTMISQVMLRGLTCIKNINHWIFPRIGGQIPEKPVPRWELWPFIKHEARFTNFTFVLASGLTILKL